MKPISTALFVGTVLSSLLMHVRTVEAATEQVLYSFCGQQNCVDGENPNGVIDVNNTLYGTSYAGGSGVGCRNEYGCGTVFSLDLSTNAEAVLHSFGRGTDGTNPTAGLVDVKGKLYGTTYTGGYYGGGTAFSVNMKAGAEKVLLSFGCCSDGFYPAAGLIDHKGTLYGTTQSGGTYGRGTVYSLDPTTGAITVLYSFCSQQNCTDGVYPFQLSYIKGILYGTTASGGAYNAGTVFSLDPATGAETVLYSFCSQQNCSDGDYPTSKVIDVHGKLYGTTGGGGSYGGGTVFSLDLNTGVETVLHSFDYTGKGGWYPVAGVIQVKSKLYGTTYYGGNKHCNSGCGTVFKLNMRTGTENLLHSFHGSDGEGPDSKLIQVNGTFYGTTELGGQNGSGTVFSITP